MAMKSATVLAVTTALLVTNLLALACAAAVSFPPASLSPLSSQKNARYKDSSLQTHCYRFIALGFSPDRQSILENGLAQALSIEKKFPNKVNAFEIAIVPPGYASVKTAVSGYMKDKVQDKALSNRIYPWYTDASSLKKNLNLPSDSEYVFLLLDPKGDVVWKTLKTFNGNDLSTVNQMILNTNFGKELR